MNTDNYENFIHEIQGFMMTLPGCSGKNVRILRKGTVSAGEDERAVIRQCNKLFNSREDVLQGDVMVAEKNMGDITAAIRINLKKEYEQCDENGMKVVKQQLQEAWEKLNSPSFTPDKMKKRMADSYEEVQKDLIVRPLNFNMHRFDLKDAVYQVMCGDVALVLYQIIGNDYSTLMTSRIMKQDLERWHMADQKEKIMRAALINTSHLYPAVVASQKRGGEEVEFLKTHVTRQDMTFCGMTMLSARKTPNGAAALFYPGVQKKMTDVMHGPFYAVFANTCDVLIFKDNDDRLHGAMRMAANGNEYGEVLSGQCYRCDGDQIRAVRVI